MEKSHDESDKENDFHNSSTSNASAFECKADAIPNNNMAMHLENKNRIININCNNNRCSFRCHHNSF